MQAAAKNNEQQLVDHIAGFYSYPLAFVYYTFPWGSGPLAGEDGPDTWQREILELLGAGVLSVDEALRIAVASGHGPGKTALIAWIILWFMSTRPHPQIVVTANTKTQLETKTWRELAKWHKLAINGHWFEWTVTKFYFKAHPETWFAAAIPWSKERAEAFAGTHEKFVLVIYDEASIIDDIIWDTTEGSLTQIGAIWLAFGNPTRNTGSFRECFGRFKHRWITRQIDSRTAKMTNKAQLQQWVDDYGEDSDFVRVRVKGQFPRASTNQLIPLDLVEAAMGRSVQQEIYRHAPLIIGVDVARFGDDQSVILTRQGGVVWPLLKFRGLDTMALAGRVALHINETNPDAVFVDEIGIGAGVIDRLRQLGHAVIGVNSGLPALDHGHYINLRAEMWGKMLEWIKAAEVGIPDDNELRDDLIGPEYGFDAKNRIQLEKKNDMKKRGLASPDCADALALTFAAPVVSQKMKWAGMAQTVAENEYALYS